MTKQECLDYLGITRFHKAGYTGKNVKIMSDEKIFEKAPTSVSKEVWDRILSPKGFRSPGGDKASHGTSVMQHLIMVAPDATFIAYPFSGTFGGKEYKSECADYIIQNGVHLFTTSSLGSTANAGKELAMQNCIDAGCTFFAAAGNDGNKGLRGESKSDKYLAIGGVVENTEEGLVKVSYSSVGPELDYVTLANILSAGTSFCVPIFTGQCGLTQDFFIIEAGRPLRRPELIKFIDDHIVDLEVPGFDKRTGHGIFILPEPSTIDIKRYVPEYVNVKKEKGLNMVIGKKEYTLDGEVKQSDVAPFIKGSRTFVPIYLLRDLGFSVEWDAKTKTVSVYK